MTQPPQIAELQFRLKWRPYQARVLDALDYHLDDQKLHIVAAPGSGKTCLGLEVFRRLASPAVVLSPTRTIRDQWLARLADFLPPGSEIPPTWTSRDLNSPGLLTSITYQALHVRYVPHGDTDNGEDNDGNESEKPDVEAPPGKTELVELAARFRQYGVGTLIFDEAHHLRKEWWEALDCLIQGLPGIKIVSLTATPPYDVIGKEWQRYEHLCGPIDEQISIPELVRAGTLCPHQDYVWAVSPSDSECIAAREYDVSADTVISEVLHEPQFLSAAQAHPWLVAPELSATVALDDPEFLSALLIFLNARGAAIPPKLLRLLDCRKEELPPFNRSWCQVFLRHFLFDELWASASPAIEEYRRMLATKLRAAGLLWRHELRLVGSPPLRNRLRMTAAKVPACVEIYKLECRFRGTTLRQVILADFIRETDLAQLGAWSIFSALITAASAEDQKLIVFLTGRLVLVHESQLPLLRDNLGELAFKMEITPSEPFPAFRRLSLPDGGGALVPPITRLFSAGHVRVLIGTRALLGEGWDAPTVNSLVLASYVGSYMLTNQMRGRALRKDPTMPDKASSIWHLVAINPATPAGMADFEELERRFGSFVGLNAVHPAIEAGLNRLALPKIDGANAILEINELAARRLLGSADLARQWSIAIDRGEDGRVVPSVEADPAFRFRRLLFQDTLRYLLFSALGTWLAVFSHMLQGMRRFQSLREILWFVVAMSGLALLVTGPKLVRAAWLWIRCFAVDGSLRQLALTLRDTLVAVDLIQSDPHRLDVRTKEVTPGRHSIALVGASYYESTLFADALEELLGPVENPRYLITRRGIDWLGLGKRDYHAVPHVLALDKEKAQLFHRHWQRRLGSAELIFTRSEDGRRALLRARVAAFSNAMQNHARRLDRWH